MLALLYVPGDTVVFANLSAVTASLAISPVEIEPFDAAVIRP